MIQQHSMWSGEGWKRRGGKKEKMGRGREEIRWRHFKLSSDVAYFAYTVKTTFVGLIIMYVM